MKKTATTTSEDTISTKSSISIKSTFNTQSTREEDDSKPGRFSSKKPTEEKESKLIEGKQPFVNVTLTSSKRVDFVLVYTTNNTTDESYRKIMTFTANLEEKGFELESSTFSINDDITFIKIHAPKRVLVHFAEIFGIELTYLNVQFKPATPRPIFAFMATPLTVPQFSGPIYQRARGTISGAPLEDITSAERGLIIYKVLTINYFGERKEDAGIEKLLRTKVFESAYPLHDGPHEWTEEGPLNDRQLLKKYWSSVKYWYKQQPLDLIETYYGSETAFYFAWLGYYNRMLIPASILGFLCFVCGAIIFLPSLSRRSEEVCGSNIYLCPRCIVEHCRYDRLKNSCFHAYLIYLFDNPLVVTFAALMSIWSTVFVELWRREEAMLQIRWQLTSIETDFSMRPGFEEMATHRKYSKITGTMEPYMPKGVLCYRYAITASVILLLIFLMMLGILGVMIYIKTITVVMTKSVDNTTMLTKNIGLIASSTGSLMSVCFILSFDLVYRRIALWLTTMENPRTQVDFDNSYTYKSYAMAFVNNYSVIFYIAFVKARFYTYPGDKRLWELMGGIGSDLCDPAGCIIELGIQMVIVLLAKNLIMTAKQYIMPQMLIFMKKVRKTKAKDIKVVDQWEIDYMLNPLVKYHMMEEYMSMIIQYGFVTFFVAAFPLAPLLALFNNLIEMRVDAFKFTSAYRRTLAIKVANIGAWNGILYGVTYIGVATNAFVIAFTSELVQRTVYRTTVNSSLVGFVNDSLSVYNTSEFPLTYQSHLNISVCYYPGKRYPPDHPQRYQLTDNHWYEITMKFLTVVVFEHIVMLITGIIAYAIPDVPFSVKEHISYHRDQLKQMKLKALDGTYVKRKKEERSDIFGWI